MMIRKAISALLVLALLVFASLALAADEEQSMPDMSGWEYVGETMMDLDDSIWGREALVREYKKDGLRLLVALLNNKPAAYWYYDAKGNRIFGLRGDADADGRFEQYLEDGGEVRFSPDAFGLDQEAGVEYGLNVSLKRYLAQKYGYVPGEDDLAVEEGSHPLPDLSSWDLVNVKRMDLDPAYPGRESEVSEYAKAGGRLFVCRVEGRPVAYWRAGKKGKPYGLRADRDGDGNFERGGKAPIGKTARVNYQTSGRDVLPVSNVEGPQARSVFLRF